MARIPVVAYPFIGISELLLPFVQHVLTFGKE